MKKISIYSRCQRTVPCLPLTREVARRSRVGGRENGIKKGFLTTPQSPAATAPLTRGAENRLFRQTEMCSFLHIFFALLYLILCFYHLANK